MPWHGSYHEIFATPKYAAEIGAKHNAALRRGMKSGRIKFVVPLVLLVATAAGAATKACPSGQLGGTLTTTGPTPDVLIARAAPALVVQATSPAGTATVVVEMSCDGTNWAPVANSSMSLAAATPSQVVSMLQPTCTYRANVTACASCSTTVFYACAGP